MVWELDQFPSSRWRGRQAATQAGPSERATLTQSLAKALKPSKTKWSWGCVWNKQPGWSVTNVAVTLSSTNGTTDIQKFIPLLRCVTDWRGWINRDCLEYDFMHLPAASYEVYWKHVWITIEKKVFLWWVSIPIWKQKKKCTKYYGTVMKTFWVPAEWHFFAHDGGQWHSERGCSKSHFVLTT